MRRALGLAHWTKLQIIARPTTERHCSTAEVGVLDPIKREQRAAARLGTHRADRRLRLEHCRSTAGRYPQTAAAAAISTGGLRSLQCSTCRTLRALSCSDPKWRGGDRGCLLPSPATHKKSRASQPLFSRQRRARPLAGANPGNEMARLKLDRGLSTAGFFAEPSRCVLCLKRRKNKTDVSGSVSFQFASEIGRLTERGHFFAWRRAGAVFNRDGASGARVVPSLNCPRQRGWRWCNSFPGVRN